MPAPEPEARGPLAGYTVLDITQMIAGPVGCTLLADMGADVIKVEPIGGESTRHDTEVVAHEALAFTVLNRGKRGIPVDLRLPAGREIVHRLVARADAAVIGYRPDVCLRFGLDYETLAAVNPRLVYLQNTAFGPRGPLADLGGYDIIVQGLSGLMALNQGLTPDGQPRQIVPAVADYLTGALIAWAVTAALLARERTGSGQKVETSLLASALTAYLGRFRYFEAQDAEPVAAFLARLGELRAQNRPWAEQLALRAEARPVIAANIYYRAYATADGYLLVACLNNPTRERFLELTGLRDPRMMDGRLVPAAEADEERRRELAALVEAAERVMRTRTSAEWLALFAAHHVPAGPLRFPEEVFWDEQVLANGYVLDMEHPLLGRYKTAAPPVRMSRTPVAVRATAPLFGEHTRAILHDLGYDAAQVAELVAAGVVAARE
jgi:crotonobetainyl-CoA:carnitine CoA-transferase CaiB-like acyl-CoA transferase